MISFTVILLVAVYVHCGNCFDEIWIKTLNSGNVDASLTPDVFNYYTSLCNIISPSQNQFRISVEACDNSFVLLSAAKDLQFQDFYEICIGAKGNKKTVFRRKYNSPNILSLHTLDILSCTERTTVVVIWTTNGKITVFKETNVGTETVMTWTDPNPISINGIGVMTAWGADGLWTIEYSSNFIGRYCGVLGTYGNMKLLSTSTQPSRMSCLSKCSPDRYCLGVNINQHTNTCELVSGMQVIEKTNNPNWSFYTKCLNGTTMCFAYIVFLKYRSS